MVISLRQQATFFLVDMHALVFLDLLGSDMSKSRKNELIFGQNGLLKLSSTVASFNW